MSELVDVEDPRVARTRRDVRDAVVAILAEDGFDGLTHARVAEQAGYARNTLYRHFPDRNALLMLATGIEDTEIHAVRTGDTRADLVGEMRAFRDALAGDVLPRLMATMIERAEHDPELADLRVQVSAMGNDQLRAVLQDAQAAGEIRDDVDADELCDRLAGPVAYVRFCRGRDMTDAAIERLVDTELAGLDRRPEG